MNAEAWLVVFTALLSGAAAVGGSIWGGRLSRAGALQAVERQIDASRRDSVVSDAVAWGGDLVGAAYRIRTMTESLAAMNRQPIPMTLGTVGRMVATMAEAQENVMAARQRLRGLQVDQLSSAVDEVAGIVGRSSTLMARQRWWDFLTFWRKDPRWAGITASLTTAIERLESVIADLSDTTEP